MGKSSCHVCQLRLAILLLVDALSISESWGVSGNTTQYNGPVLMAVKLKLVLPKAKEMEISANLRVYIYVVQEGLSTTKTTDKLCQHVELPSLVRSPKSMQRNIRALSSIGNS